MTTERSNQPSNVSTEETPRAPDEHVVTSDLPKEAEPRGGRSGAPPAAADGKPDGANDPDSATGDPQKQRPKRDRSSERRIARLSAKIAEAEAREAAQAKRVADLEAEVEALARAKPKPKEPQLQDFPNPREYAKAYAKWEQGSANPPPAPKPRAASTPPANPADSVPAPPDDEISEFRDRGKEKLGNLFEEALALPGTAVSQVMGHFMLDSDLGPELYVHLADHPRLSRRIFDMKDADRQTAELEKLEKAIADGTIKVSDGELRGDLGDGDKGGTPKPKTPSRVTNAPAPPSNVISGGDGDLTSDPENESMDDYAVRRRKEMARRQGRIT